MKHLKSFWESISSEPLYYEIGELNPDERKEVPLEKSVFDLIKSRLKDGFSISKEVWARIDYLVCEPDCTVCRGLGGKHSPQTDFYFDIFPLDDEWFDVEYLDARDKSYGRTMFNSHYFRCDGVEGLLQFLEDEDIIESVDDELKTSLSIKENVQEQLWEFISMSDYLNRKSTHGLDLSFTEVDKSQIRKSIRNDGYDYSMSGIETLEIEITNWDEGDGQKKFVECVKKSPDDWFYVKEYYYFWHKGDKFSGWRQGSYRPLEDSESFWESYIKCDTIEGLIQFIKSRREYLYKL